ncbi:MAG: hypothetical protein HY318_01495 [Armatimonadetes bacterium]|nr:hypothetical protein [Armatimonadota bacterium]
MLIRQNRQRRGRKRPGDHTPVRRGPLQVIAVAVALCGLTNAGYAQEVEGSVSVGTGSFGPWSMDLNPATNRLYVANFYSDNVSVLDTVTNKFMPPIPVESGPRALAVDPGINRIYVASYFSSPAKVTVIDGNTHKAMATIPVDLNPTALALDKQRHLLYVGHASSNTVSVIDTSTNTLIDEIYLSQNRTNSLALNPAKNRLYALRETGNLSVVDTETRTEVGLIIGAGGEPTCVAVDSLSNRIYVTDGATNALRVYNATDNSFLRSIAVGVGPSTVAVDETGHRAYIANQYDDSLTVIDTNNNTSIAVLPVGSGPVDLVLHPTLPRAYVANFADTSLSVLDTATPAVLAVVPLGFGPWGVAVDEAANRIYMTAYNNNSVSVIDSALRVQIASLGVGRNPRGLAVDPTSHRVYVANSGENTVSVLTASHSEIRPRIPVGGVPVDVAIDPILGQVYVANRASHTVAVINTATNTVFKEIPLANTPEALAVDPVTGRVFVACSDNNTLTVIDGQTTTVDNSIPLGEAVPVAVAVDPVEHTVYVAGQRSEQVLAINGSTLAILKAIGLKELPANVAITQPRGLGVNPQTRRVYVTGDGIDSQSGKVLVMDGSSYSALSSLPVGYSPQGIAVDTQSNKIYVANHDSDSLSVIRGADNELEAVISGDRLSGTAYSAFSSKIYVANYFDDSVIVLDARTNEILDVLRGSFSQPFSLAVDETEHKVYVTNQGDDTVTIIDEATGSLEVISLTEEGATLSVRARPGQSLAERRSGPHRSNLLAYRRSVPRAAKKQPAGIAVDSSRRRSYVANVARNSVDVLDLSTPKKRVIKTIPVGVEPIAVALDPARGRAYVANYGEDTLSVIDETSNTEIFPRVGVGDGPLSVAVIPTTHEIIVANALDSSVWKIGGDPLAVLSKQTLTLPPDAVTIDPETDIAYLVHTKDQAFTALQVATMNALKTVSWTSPGRALATGFVVRSVSVGSASPRFSRGRVVRGRQASTEPLPGGIAMNLEDNRVYITDPEQTALVVVGKDKVPPVITSTKMEPLTLPSTGGEIRMEVGVSDNVGVKSVTGLIAKSDGTSVTVNLSLKATAAAPGTWEGSYNVPGNPSASPVEYQIVFTAQDVVGNPSDPSSPLTLTVDKEVEVHDLAVQSVTASPKKPRRGQIVTVTVKLKNEGTVAEKNVKVQLKVKGTLLKETTVSTIGKGETKTVTMKVVVVPRTGKPGAYTLEATAVPVTGETDTADNTKTLAMTVTRSLTGLEGEECDLSFGTVRVLPLRLSLGRSKAVRVEALVFNRGPEVARDVVLLVFSGREQIGFQRLGDVPARKAVRFQETLLFRSRLPDLAADLRCVLLTASGDVNPRDNLFASPLRTR